MRDEDIRVGDVLRIRRWEDMEAEFGLTEDGEIPCVDTFTPYMRDLCGMTFTVRSVNTYDNLNNDYEAKEPGFGKWIISADMLEPFAEDETVEPESPDSLFGFLLS